MKNVKEEKRPGRFVVGVRSGCLHWEPLCSVSGFQGVWLCGGMDRVDHNSLERLIKREQ